MITFFPTNQNVAASIGRYNAGLTEESLGRMREAVAMEEARQRAQMQGQVLQQQNQQANQVNALRQQELNQQSQFQQAQLANQRAQTQAQMDWQKALMGNNAGESQKDRENRLKIAEVTAGARNAGPSATDIEAMNAESQAMAGRLNFALKGLKDAQTAEEAKAKAEFATNMGSFSPFTLDSTYKKKHEDKLGEIGNRYRGEFQRLIQSVPKDSLLDFDQTRMEFIPRAIGGKPTAAGSAGGKEPAGSGGFFGQGKGPTPDMILQEAADAIAKGADPALIQQRLQTNFGISLPQIAPPTGVPSNVWPPVAEPPPVVRGGVMPIPGMAVPVMPSPIARGYFGGEQFPAQFSDLGR